MKKIMYQLICMIFIVSSHIYGSEVQMREKINVLTYNIDTNILRTEEGYARDAFPQWRVKSRMPLLTATLESIINQEDPSVIQLQEGRKFTNKFGEEVDSITPLVYFLKSKNYTVSVSPYNPTDRAFLYITAIHNKFSVNGHSVTYLTKTPENPTDHTLPLAAVKDNNFGEEWERSVYSIKFSDDSGQTYETFNVHLGIGLDHRKKSCEILTQLANNTVKANPNTKIIMTGDFNTFEDWGGPEQLEIMQTNTVLDEVTKKLTLANGKKVNTTFIAFPYDFAANEKILNLTSLLISLDKESRKQKIGQVFAQECQALGGHLDRIYCHGFHTTSAELLPAPVDSNFDISSFSEPYVKEYIMNHLDKGPAFASDHQPIIAKLQ